MGDENLRLEWIDPKTLTPNPSNWRVHPPAQREALAGVLSEVGWAGALLWNERTSRLVDGHLRLDVALRENRDAVPVLIGNWTDVQEKEILATLDPIAAMAEADSAQLDALLREVNSGSAAVMDMLAGLAEDAGLYLDEKPIGAGGDDFDPTPQKGETRAKRGDLWQLGQHRLLVDDCTIAANVARLMGSEKAGMVWADPPYGMSFQSNHRTASPKFDLIDGDDKPLVEFIPTIQSIPVWYICCRWDVAGVFINAITEARFKVVNWIVWHKSRGGMGDLEAAYRPTHETILYCSKDRQIFTREGRDDDTWDIDTDAPSAYEHPTQKPIALPQRAIANHAPKGAIIYDPFLGSGTTLIAAERLGRKCYGCEISEQYADVILRRYEAETGQEAQLVERVQAETSDDSTL